MDKRVVRFQHCSGEIYGFFVPELCPVCGESLSHRRLEDAPVSIPSPFTDGHQAKCSFLVKPTKGTFLRDYDGKSDLHVGITSTAGMVYNYREGGVCQDMSGWEQAVSVALVQPDMYSLIDQWDHYLEHFSQADTWDPKRYNENDHNCYTFALTFINCVLITQGSRQLSKNEFTERFVLPRTKRASKYITLYQEISENHFYIVDTAQDHTQNENV
ncbi:MKRN2 opposite strand protein isoform X4 [Erpetoichthys calabaricus]|uniref:MKRN2 opposite strand n=1 Tax=Erpetoichthys calabaricus TaxID=27687 RepID=A0A8C4TC54_ERPCA|nr:MKRN2 opposite strand protein isoform X2 [Erpetoichthys calabaricus]XP_051777496.1 MKRN2 opposite strand protein isoform X3 [Erpetoichthys calabaricus]XP_051777498.1 MKRN2 opposite strand protein isoform X4 [Erpetoichthys calabaricus]